VAAYSGAHVSRRQRIAARSISVTLKRRVAAYALRISRALPRRRARKRRGGGGMAWRRNKRVWRNVARHRAARRAAQRAGGQQIGISNGINIAGMARAAASIIS